MKSGGKKNRCHGRTKDGKPCRAAATAGGLCFFHANPNKASELGRIGGRRNGHTGVVESDPLPAVDTAKPFKTPSLVYSAIFTRGKFSPTSQQP